MAKLSKGIVILRSEGGKKNFTCADRGCGGLISIVVVLLIQEVIVGACKEGLRRRVPVFGLLVLAYGIAVPEEGEPDGVVAASEGDFDVRP